MTEEGEDQIRGTPGREPLAEEQPLGAERVMDGLHRNARAGRNLIHRGRGVPTLEPIEVGSRLRTKWSGASENEVVYREYDRPRNWPGTDD